MKEVKEIKKSKQTTQVELNALTVEFVSHIGDRDSKMTLDVLIEAIRTVFSGSFYRAAFTVLLVQENDR